MTIYIDEADPDLRPTPRELLRRYYPLSDAVRALAVLAEVNGGKVLEDVIELAMVMAIHAEQRRVEFRHHQELIAKQGLGSWIGVAQGDTHEP